MSRDIDGIIKQKYAESGDVGLGGLTLAELWPISYSTPGGQHPQRIQFNQLFRYLSALGVEINSKGPFLDYNGVDPTGPDYEIGAVVRGSDGENYVCLIPNGPGSTIVDPVGDLTGTWAFPISNPTGFKNILINGNKRVNQRGYAGGVLADGDYGYDRWKGADTDVNIEQIIEQENIVSGSYTISWVGGGTATVDGNSGLSSGDSVDITVVSDISVKVPKASTDIQFEAGGIATTFELRSMGLEVTLCKYYYHESSKIHSFAPRSGTAFSTSSKLNIMFPQSMRVAPTVIISGSDNVSGVGIDATDEYSVQIAATANAAATGSITGYTADAEL